MRILTIGDIHGRDIWKSVNIDNYDKIIFIGDYVDSFTYTPFQCLNNLVDICNLKEAYPDKIVLLLGNHDIHYMYLEPRYRGSGFNASMSYSFQEYFFNKIYDFKIAFQIDNYLWTHAGINKPWSIRYLNDVNSHDISNELNDMIHTSAGRDALFEVGENRNVYNFSNELSEETGGPIWSDKLETLNLPYKGLNQIVGHSKVNSIETHNIENGSITYIDCLDTVDKFYELNI